MIKITSIIMNNCIGSEFQNVYYFKNKQIVIYKNKLFIDKKPYQIYPKTHYIISKSYIEIIYCNSKK